MSRTLSTLVITLILAALPAVSAPAATPISACGTIVTDPGDYILAQDLFCEADQQGIWVLSSDVTIDFDRHTVTCNTSGENRVGAVLVGDYTDPELVLENVTIKNGIATGCDDGVALFSTRGAEVTKMYFYDNVEDGLVLVGAENTLAHGIKATRNAGWGIVSWFGAGNTFRNNRFAANGDGIWIYAETGSQLLCNKSTFNVLGIGVGGWSSGNVVRGNITNFNSDSGILLLANGELPEVVLEPVWDNLVEHNISLGNAASDIVDVVWDGANWWTLPECQNKWATNHFVSTLGSTDCLAAPVSMYTVDVCGMATGVLTPAVVAPPASR